MGRPTTPPGACPESARMLYRARLITSGVVCTAVVYYREFFSAGRRSLTHFARSLAWSVASGYDSGPAVALRFRTLTDSDLSVA